MNKPYAWCVSNVDLVKSSNDTASQLIAAEEWKALCEFRKDHPDKPYICVVLENSGEGVRGYIVGDTE
jgi:hypothetical protein